jgi:hypothetical protein
MSAEEQMREIALDWLKNSDDDNTKALRGYVLQMLSGANLQIRELWKLIEDQPGDPDAPFYQTAILEWSNRYHALKAKYGVTLKPK